jgi:hypothetical protein
VPRKPNPRPDDEEHAKRFIETAKQLESDESEQCFEAAFESTTTTSVLAKTSVPKRRPKGSRSA